MEAVFIFEELFRWIKNLEGKKLWGYLVRKVNRPHYWQIDIYFEGPFGIIYRLTIYWKCWCQISSGTVSHPDTNGETLIVDNPHDTSLYTDHGITRCELHCPLLDEDEGEYSYIHKDF